MHMAISESSVVYPLPMCLFTYFEVLGIPWNSKAFITWASVKGLFTNSRTAPAASPMNAPIIQPYLFYN